jgi:transcription elongation factor Elf1
MPYKDLKDPKRKETYKRYYAKHGYKVKAATAKRRKEAREKWQDYKKTLYCVECGQKHPATLDFHHVIKDDKKVVTDLIRNGQLKRAMEEVQKCVVLCANCHRIHHWEEIRAKRKAKKAARKK